jgi:predicted enzyme related to lactoylglutathione lyase
MQFYSKIFDATMTVQKGMGTELAILPGMNGAIIKGEDYVPSQTGVVIYLDGAPDLNVILDRVEKAGGKVLLPKTGIAEHGYPAYFEDTEGNKIGLHSSG